MQADLIVPARSARFVVVHYHIFKNAGSTIESILERAFPKRFAKLHGPDANCTLDGKDLEKFLRRNPDVAAVSSHHLRYPKPALRDIVLFDCCFLRHPADRLQSMYTFLRKTDSDSAPARIARTRTAGEFVRALILDFPHLVTNVQVVQLGSRGVFARPPGVRELERSTRVVSDMAIPGLLEMFEESLVTAEYFLRGAFPGLCLEFTAQNVSRPWKPDAERQADLREAWGSATYDDVLRLNELDLELHRRTRLEIARRSALLPHLAERLADFKGRCADLTGLRAAS